MEIGMEMSNKLRISTMNKTIKGFLAGILGSSYFVGMLTWMHFDQRTTKFPMKLWQLTCLDILGIIGIFVAFFCIFTIVSHDDTEEKYDWLVGEYGKEH